MNASGKTTISRHVKISDENCYVFNKDYIAKNVYSEVFKDDEILIDASDSFSTGNDIFFGEDINNDISKLEALTKEMANLESTCKDNLKIYHEDISDAINYMLVEKLIQNKTINTAKKYPLSDFVSLDLETISEINDLYKLVSENDFYEILNKKINEVKVIIEATNKKIEEFNKQKNDLLASHPLYKMYQESLKIPDEKFIFMEHTYIKADVEKYFIENIKNRSEAVIKLIKTNYGKINDATKQIRNEISSREINSGYKKMMKSIYEIDELVSQYLKNKIYGVSLQSIDVFEFKADDNKAKLIKIISDNRTRLYKEPKLLKRIIKRYLELEDEEENINEQIEFKQNEVTDKIISRINCHLDKFDASNLELRKVLKSKTSKGKSSNGKGSKKEVGIEMKQKDITFLSEGEKRVIALSYFLADLEQKLNDNKEPITVFIDDPFDSNDHYKSDRFPHLDFVINGEEIKILKYFKESNRNKLIISTHNISVMSSISKTLIDQRSCKTDLCFSPMQNDVNDFFQFLTIEKKENESVLESFNPSLLHPYENNVEKEIKNQLKGILLEAKNVEVSKHLKFLLLILMKLKDGVDNNMRNHIKPLITCDEFESGSAKRKDVKISEFQNKF